MAKRFYFPDGNPGDVTPPAPVGSTTWEHINASGNVIQKLFDGPDASALATVAYTPDAADDLVSPDKDSCHRQYISGALAAQTLTGNIKGQFQCSEAHANNNLFITLKVLVCSNDGSTTRATLLAITRATSLETTTTLTNRTFPSTALTNYACTEGDRLVLEVGLGGNSGPATGGTQGHNGSIRWGCVASGGDLAINETETGTTFRPWVEFSTDPVLAPVPTIASQRASSLGSICATWAAVIATPLFASVLLQDTAVASAPPPPRSTANQTLIIQSWPQPEWPSQHAPYTPNKANSFDPVISRVPYSRASSLPTSSWEQPQWDTIVARKLAKTGPEVYPMPKSDHGQGIIAQWPQSDWPTQVTRKTQPVVIPDNPIPLRRIDSIVARWSETVIKPLWKGFLYQDTAFVAPSAVPPARALPEAIYSSWEPKPLEPVWGFRLVQDYVQPYRDDSFWSILEQWKVTPWDTQVTKKVTASGPVSAQPPKSPFPIAIHSSWEPATWYTQQTKKLTTQPVADTRVPRNDWGQRIIQSGWPQPDWSTLYSVKVTYTGPEVYPVSRTDYGQLEVSLWPQADWPTQGTRKTPIPAPVVTPDNPIPRNDAGQASIRQWPQNDWDTQYTRKIQTSGPVFDYPARIDHGQSAISQWSQPTWDTQVTRKVPYTGPEVYPVSLTTYGQLEVSLWSQPQWDTQQTRKRAYSGPEAFPMPKTDHGQRIVALWPQQEWASQRAGRQYPGSYVLVLDSGVYLITGSDTSLIFAPVGGVQPPFTLATMGYGR